MADPVTIVDPDPSWPATFASIRDRVAPALGALVVRIEHVGSTSVRGLPAKPIVDLDVVVADRDVPEAIARLAVLGYRHRGDLGVPGREAFDAPPDAPDQHLYVVRPDTPAFRAHLAFRDHLRATPAARAAYGALKRELAKRCGDDRDAYTEGKTAFVHAALAAAGYRVDSRQVTIRRLEPSDADAVSELGRRYLDGWRRLVEVPDDYVFVEMEEALGGAIDGFVITVAGRAEPVGFALVTREIPRFIEDFFVDVSVRGRGVGEAAARAVLDRNPGRWSLSVRDENAPALRFWERALAGAEVTREHRVDAAGAGRTFLFFRWPPG